MFPFCDPSCCGKRAETKMKVVDGVPSASTEIKSAPALAGVGIIFAGLEGQYLLIVDAMVPGGPAEICGQVRLGDQLVSVDGYDVCGMADDELAKLIIGPVGTKVTLGLLRGRSDPQLLYASIVRGYSVQRNSVQPAPQPPSHYPPSHYPAYPPQQWPQEPSVKEAGQFAQSHLPYGGNARPQGNRSQGTWPTTI